MVGCYFHLQEANYTHLQQLTIETTSGLVKMSQLYETNVDFAIDMRLFAAIAFVPVENVYSVFDDLVLKLQGKYNQAINEYIAYFQTTYVGSLVGTQRMRPLFDIKLWNLHDAVISNDPLTNNAVEGHNNALKLMSPGSHLTIQRFIELIKEDMQNSSLVINEMLAGKEAPPRKKKYRDLAERVKNIVRNYDVYEEKVEFLKQIAQIFVV